MPKTLTRTQELEARTEADVHRILQAAGIMEGSQDYRDYERVKKMLFQGRWIDSTVYDKQISWILGYLSL